MPETLPTIASAQSDQKAIAFYRHVLETLNASGIPFLVGGAYSLSAYTGINRDTKDLDLFVLRDDYDRISETLRQAGYDTEMTYPHWLAKVRFEGELIDLIFSSGNGIATVDQGWFVHAIDDDVLGVPVKICPAEETIWSKAFIMERERYDGADVVHLLRTYGKRLDWSRLMQRFEPHWRVLLSHLVLFGFIYPGQRNLVPTAVMDELLDRLRQEIHAAPPEDNICLGTLLSREQYLVDVSDRGYQDARVMPIGNMTPQDTANWTAAIPGKQEEQQAR